MGNFRNYSVGGGKKDKILYRKSIQKFWADFILVFILTSGSRPRRLVKGNKKQRPEGIIKGKPLVTSGGEIFRTCPDRPWESTPPPVQ